MDPLVELILQFLVQLIAIVALTLYLVKQLREDWVYITRPTAITKGRVIGHRITRVELTKQYVAQIEFSDSISKVHTIDAAVREDYKTPDVNAEVTVIYPLHDPSKAREHRPITSTIVYVLTSLFIGLLISSLLKWIGY